MPELTPAELRHVAQLAEELDSNYTDIVEEVTVRNGEGQQVGVLSQAADGFKFVVGE